MHTLRALWLAVLVSGVTLACGENAGGEGDDEAVPDTIVVEEEGDLEEAVEETGEAVGEGAEEVGEAVGEGAEEIGDKTEDAADAVD